MKRYVVECQQVFNATYMVEAESREEAWQKLLEGDASNWDQSPAELLSTIDEAYIEEYAY